jgi:hypothetical protein
MFTRPGKSLWIDDHPDMTMAYHGWTR